MKVSADKPVEAGEVDLEPVTVDLSKDELETEDTDVDEVADTAQEGTDPSALTPTPTKTLVTRQSSRRPSKDGYSKGVEKTLNEVGQLRETVTGLQQALQQQNAFIQQMLMQQQGGQRGAQGAQDGGDAFQAKEQQILAEQDQIMAMVRAGNLTQEAADTYSRRYKALDRELVRLDIEKQLQQTNQRGQQAQRGEDPAVGQARGLLELEFPEVMRDEAAREQAKAYHAYLVASGRPDGLGLLREAAAFVATKRGLRRGPVQPSNGARAALSGVQSGATGEDSSTFVFDQRALRQIAGSGVTPEQIAAQMAQERRGGR